MDQIDPDVRRLVEAHVTDGTALTPELDLIDAEVLDSLGIFTLVGELEATLGISIEPEAVTLDNFGTLAAIDALVRTRRAG